MTIENETTAAPAPYMAAAADEEFKRLRSQGKLIEAPTISLIEQAGIARGMQVLDAGCGAGAALDLLADKVGPEGSVTGIDVNAGLIERLQEHLRSTGRSTVSAQTQDFLSTPPPPAHYDLIISRLVFLHLGDHQAQACSNLWKSLKPGGTLIIMEHDYRALDSAPATQAASMFKDAMLTVLAAGGLDPHSGSLLPQVFQQAGLGLPDDVSVSCQLRALTEAKAVMLASYHALVAIAGRLTDCNIPSYADFAGAVERAESQGHPYVFLPLLVSALKRKPSDAR